MIDVKAQSELAHVAATYATVRLREPAGSTVERAASAVLDWAARHAPPDIRACVDDMRTAIGVRAFVRAWFRFRDLHDQLAADDARVRTPAPPSDTPPYGSRVRPR